MPLSDLALADLRAFRPTVREPADFDDFWSRTLAEANTHDLSLRVDALATVYRTIDVHDVSFAGSGGDRINAWYTRPAGVDQDLPVVVEFIGYGGGRGLAGQALHWASAGFAHLYVDTRGQGMSWGDGGSTADTAGSEPTSPGFMTRGILDPETYYYRRVFTDAVRAVHAARALPGVDVDQVAVQGISQGGGITLAVAGLVPDLVAVMPDVPFLCHFERALDVSATDPYGEITRYLAVNRHSDEQVLSTLSYFDGVNFAKRATAPALFSAAGMDGICPPSTVFAAFNAYRPDDKAIEFYRYNGHEGGTGHQREAQTRWLSARVR
ncbi:acetylxylan esterase [Subtercola sp. PAMC28395]|uniref:acetylxylan esterase n=1 Tax=Subtercola sp. PAMC28395 TaxID=2846775 RepID=UPI001C0ACDC7|nr:acetylxylan esterase [Subtercola sp. PAMC28395]QWT24717.1 acetylxylan esterase [Subtercola sp. PAMC28395]